MTVVKPCFEFGLVFRMKLKELFSHQMNRVPDQSYVAWIARISSSNTALLHKYVAADVSNFFRFFRSDQFSLKRYAQELEESIQVLKRFWPMFAGSHLHSLLKLLLACKHYRQCEH